MGSECSQRRLLGTESWVSRCLEVGQTRRNGESSAEQRRTEKGSPKPK